MQIAGAGKRPVLCCRDFKLGARHSTLQRKSTLDTQTSQSELSLADAMHQFDTGDRNRRGREALEAQHRGDLLFHAPMVLLDQIIQGRCQSNCGSSTLNATRPLANDDLRRKGAPLRQCGRASLCVNLPGDEMPLLIEMVVDLGVN